jgi:rhamnosyltransferase subunit B
MAKLLFTYEFGAGLGHLNRLLAVATRLREGNELVFVLPHMGLGSVVREILGPQVEIRKGVAWRPPIDPEAKHVPTRTFADVMQLFGYHQVQDLATAAGSWIRILEETAPSVIISDFAPTLRLAAATAIPMIVLGSGYTVPPAHNLLPPMRPWDLSVPPESRMHEFALLAAVNDVCAKLRRPRVDYFSDLFQGDSTFVCTLTEFDPYGKVRSDVLAWPFNVPNMPEAREFCQRRGPVVFCYLQAGHPTLDALLDALGTLDCTCAIYIGGARPRDLVEKCAANIHLYSTPPNLGSVLPETSVLIHHAGLGTAYAGLMAGVPQLVFPVGLEQLITARGLAQFKVTVPVRATPPPEARVLRGIIEVTLSDSARRASSLSAARGLQARRDKHSLDRVAAACRDYL